MFSEISPNTRFRFSVSFDFNAYAGADATLSSNPTGASFPYAMVYTVALFCNVFAVLLIVPSPPPLVGAPSVSKITYLLETSFTTSSLSKVLARFNAPLMFVSPAVPGFLNAQSEAKSVLASTQYF